MSIRHTVPCMSMTDLHWRPFNEDTSLSYHFRSRVGILDRISWWNFHRLWTIAADLKLRNFEVQKGLKGLKGLNGLNKPLESAVTSGEVEKMS